MAKKKAKAHKEDILRIASFILLDATLFHEILSGTIKGIRPISSLSSPLKNSLIKEWEKILKVDYESIFRIGLRIIRNLPSSPKIEFMLKEITSLTSKIASSGTYLRHDLMGRIYHKLLLRTTGGYYATYYTSIPAAVLLSHLIVRPRNPDLNWNFGDEESIKHLRIIDPACGSGTLLSAIYTAIRNEYLLHKDNKDLKKLHRILLENTIYGLDVLDYASHLTLTSLSLHNPKGIFDYANIYTLPIGILGKKVYLGSLDFLRTVEQLTLMGKEWTLPLRRYDLSEAEEIYKALKIDPHYFDIVIMNPPFSRSAKPNIKFGFATETVKLLMSKELQKIAKEFKVKLQNEEEIDLTGIGQAGLGAYFVFVADKLLKDGGRLGLVIPRALLSGVSWEKVRKLLYYNYEIEYIVSNFDPGDKNLGIEGWNWSENTDLGEILIVARKTRKPLGDRKTAFINLHNKPGNAVESILISQQILNTRNKLKKTIKNNEYNFIKLGNKDIGYIYTLSQKDLNINFLYPCLFNNPELNYLLIEFNNIIPTIQFNKLLKETGIDIKQIKTCFIQKERPCTYRILWGHQSLLNTIQLKTKFIKYGKLIVQKERAEKIYSKRARFLLASRPHLNTECLIATLSDEKILATAFWELKFSEDIWEKVFVLWFNSTFGIFLYLQHTENSMGQIFKCKKGHVEYMKVIDPLKIDVKKAVKLYEKIKTASLMPFPEEFLIAFQGKGVRKTIDDFFIKELRLDIDLKPYYKMLSKEPILSTKRL